MTPNRSTKLCTLKQKTAVSHRQPALRCRSLLPTQKQPTAPRQPTEFQSGPHLSFFSILRREISLLRLRTFLGCIKLLSYAFTTTGCGMGSSRSVALKTTLILHAGNDRVALLPKGQHAAAMHWIGTCQPVTCCCEAHKMVRAQNQG